MCVCVVCFLGEEGRHGIIVVNKMVCSKIFFEVVAK